MGIFFKRNQKGKRTYKIKVIWRFKTEKKGGSHSSCLRLMVPREEVERALQRESRGPGPAGTWPLIATYLEQAGEFLESSFSFVK